MQGLGRPGNGLTAAAVMYGCFELAGITECLLTVINFDKTLVGHVCVITIQKTHMVDLYQLGTQYTYFIPIQRESQRRPSIDQK